MRSTSASAEGDVDEDMASTIAVAATRLPCKAETRDARPKAAYLLAITSSPKLTKSATPSRVGDAFCQVQRQNPSPSFLGGMAWFVHLPVQFDDKKTGVG